MTEIFVGRNCSFEISCRIVEGLTWDSKEVSLLGSITGRSGSYLGKD